MKGGGEDEIMASIFPQSNLDTTDILVYEYEINTELLSPEPDLIVFKVSSPSFIKMPYGLKSPSSPYATTCLAKAKAISPDPCNQTHSSPTPFVSFLTL